ncbi:hypothetical protein KQ299_04850, partial [Synechococcus sp. CS-603]|nr:hypothetical protein [Synechococcus sp. CS-603]
VSSSLDVLRQMRRELGIADAEHEQLLEELGVEDPALLDPDQLFRELIRASPDGTVPPHLLQRLQELEGNRQEQQRRERGVAPAAGPAGPAATTKRQGPLRSLRAASGEQQELYSEFHQLLLEGDDD